jgi:hypothetical protein
MFTFSMSHLTDFCDFPFSNTIHPIEQEVVRDKEVRLFRTNGFVCLYMVHIAISFTDNPATTGSRS